MSISPGAIVWAGSWAGPEHAVVEIHQSSEDLSYVCRHDLDFISRNPFLEAVNFTLPPSTVSAAVTLVIRAESGSELAVAQHECGAEWFRPEGKKQVLRLVLTKPAESGSQSRQPVGEVDVRLAVVTAASFSHWGSRVLPSTADHPLSQHNGGRSAEYDMCMPSTDDMEQIVDHLGHSGQPASAHRDRPRRWRPARAIALANYEQIFRQPAETWCVPGPDELMEDSMAPPVAHVTGMILHLLSDLIACRCSDLWSESAHYQVAILAA